MSITTAQIRGARGILNWSQQDLAKRTGISATSIGSIENGITTPRENTLTTIRKTFEGTGIEFIGLEGVRLRTGDVKLYKGKQGFIDFYNDLFEEIKTTGGEIFVSNVNERMFDRILGDFAHTHVARMAKVTDLNYKIIINEDDNYAPGSSYAEYRKIPSDLFSSVPFYIYGETLAIMVFEGEPSIIALHFPAIAHAYKVQFQDMWNRSSKLEGPNVIREVQGSGA